MRPLSLLAKVPAIRPIIHRLLSFHGKTPPDLKKLCLSDLILIYVCIRMVRSIRQVLIIESLDIACKTYA